ncbi:YigZ family protein [Nicoliella spurrieriana]|uniref:YigZ family protein n=1 Tax=Nicoliella spurrieriana TaxID=2925830 RepID=A0A976RSE0_9LACO|nr:YigZ family protein [Nicoliella spurrieriana]UQS86988.1 YigZ family protein [Nicoliella spurrieriana]
MEKEQTYLTVKTSGSNEIDIKKSRFIGSVKRVKTEAEAKEFVAQIIEENKSATHNCFAYMVGQDDHIQRKSDNGEPSGTAGLPILDAIKLKQLHDVAVVVTRYFGGIKLGAGGLIRAYSNATTEAINKVGVVERILQTKINIEIEYSLLEQLKYFLEQSDIYIDDIQYGADVTVVVAVPADQIEGFKKQVIELLNDRAKISTGDQEYFEVDYHQGKDRYKKGSIDLK